MSDLINRAAVVVAQSAVVNNGRSIGDLSSVLVALAVVVLSASLDVGEYHPIAGVADVLVLAANVGKSGGFLVWFSVKVPA
jgi:hypothetical protein